MAYTGKERRKYPRFDAKLIVSYRVATEKNNVDISQSKNLGFGGMLLATNRAFKPGVMLALIVRLPFAHEPVRVVARVEESKERVKDTVFDTRLSFVSIDEKDALPMKEALAYYAKKKS